MWLNYIYAFTGVRYFYFNQMTPTCFDPLFWSTALVQCFGLFTEPTAGSFGLQILSRSPGLFPWCWRQVKKGVAEKAEAIILESGQKVDSDDERKKVYSISNWYYVHRSTWKAISLFLHTLFALKTHSRAHGRSDSQSCGNFFGNLIEQQNITIIQ